MTGASKAHEPPLQVAHYLFLTRSSARATSFRTFRPVRFQQHQSLHTLAGQLFGASAPVSQPEDATWTLFAAMVAGSATVLIAEELLASKTVEMEQRLLQAVAQIAVTTDAAVPSSLADVSALAEIAKGPVPRQHPMALHLDKQLGHHLTSAVMQEAAARQDVISSVRRARSQYTETRRKQHLQAKREEEGYTIPLF